MILAEVAQHRVLNPYVLLSLVWELDALSPLLVCARKAANELGGAFGNLLLRRLDADVDEITELRKERLLQRSLSHIHSDEILEFVERYLNYTAGEFYDRAYTSSIDIQHFIDIFENLLLNYEAQEALALRSDAFPIYKVNWKISKFQIKAGWVLFAPFVYMIEENSFENLTPREVSKRIREILLTGEPLALNNILQRRLIPEPPVPQDMVTCGRVCDRT